MNNKLIKDLCKDYSLENHVTYFWQIGPLKLWLKKTPDEILLAETSDNDKSIKLIIAEKKDKPANIEWKRWIIKIPSDKINFTVTMSDIPVVVRPENELTILPDEKALFFVLLPVWLTISAETKLSKDKIITSIPSLKLSQTWFGNFQHGELAYSLKTSARRTLDNIKLGFHQAACPVNIHNNSSSDLEFKRLCLETKFLSIYQTEKFMQTNEISVTFRGEEHISAIKYSEKPPANLDIPKPISLPKNKVPKSFAKKSFNTLKSFTGF